MRLSKREAKAAAVRIAEQFVRSHGKTVWRCLGAKPDVLAPDSKVRKNVIKWCVTFQEPAFVGASIVLVDIEACGARFF